VIADAINGAILRLYTALKSEDGQTFVEYSLIGVLVAVVLAAVLTTFEGQIAGALGNIGGKL
jgi:Flp pilus assembly pilin Flp